MVTSDKPRVESPSNADLGAVVSDNNAFALDLYQQLRAQPGNLFYSPFSISEALAMAWAGARGETEEAMATALHFSLPQDRLHPAMNAVDLALASRGHDAQGSDGGAFRLNIANAMWGQLGYQFQPTFLDALGENYGAGMHVVDFIKSPEDSRGIINQWVSDRTEGKIKDLLPSGTVTPDTRLVLTNAIYFNAAWATPFEAKDTKPADFTRRDGSTIQVPTMAGFPETGYGEGADYAAVSLPYDAGVDKPHELEMVLVLPKGDIDAFEATLDATKLDEVVKSLSEHGVTLTMPRYTIASQFSLNETLGKMGMGVAFDAGKADFTGINAAGKLYISDVVHKAWVTVDEAGTEAAAATGVVFGETSAPEPATLHLDHPYVFFIRDIATKAILFIGRVEDPSA
jgi:serpin B